MKLGEKSCPSQLASITHPNHTGAKVYPESHLGSGVYLITLGIKRVGQTAPDPVLTF